MTESAEISVCAATPLVTFGVLTDVQYADCEDKPAGYDPSLIRYYRNSLNQVKHAFEHWSRMSGVSLVLQLGDLVDENNASCEVGLERVLTLFSQLPVYHTVGNHELYNWDRHTLAEHYVCEGLVSKAEPVFYYSFVPVPGVRFVSLDCFEVSVLGYGAEHPRRHVAAELLAQKHGTWDESKWEWPDALSGLEQRFINSNGAVSQEQLLWLDGELRHADAAGEVVVVFGHLALCPNSANPDCLLWNYAEVQAVLETHPSSTLYLCGHAHRCGYSTNGRGMHYMALAGIIETSPSTVAYSTISVYQDRIEIHGAGREESRTLWFRTSEAPEEPLEVNPVVKVVV
ncbi:manganese-dependent ADP-ribose/CDP-alcohol diphosphatase-like [Ornithodoros turicata]|uniref:manganese-dependent ADP-ribose/CDP-alcohol diphosphatase-like n=1 Tax=Ornithodoros turicata TaxID=34597 RepID=UPI00313A2C50